ncbi:hypothetical protein WJ16_07640 [Burkholderia metallica]|nr:hypothetical protein WJ16_07640 [Burkholderia metallica]
MRRFAHALGNKLLSAQRKYGYSDNWMRDDWADECRAELMRHIQKGDPRDVAAYCAFLWHHNESTAAAAGQEAVAWQVRRTEISPTGAPIQRENCTKELHDATLATGRYAGYDNGPRCEVRALYTAPPAQVATRQEMTDEQWYDLASRHANAEWNSDGYLASVKSLCDDYRALLDGDKQ